MLNAFFILSIVSWFFTGVVLFLFFFEPAKGWLEGFNLKYGEKLASGLHIKGGATKVARGLFWIEVAAFAAATIVSFNPIFGFWGAGFALFGIRYFSELLRKKEIEKFDNQMLDVIFGFRNSLKAGMSLQQAMQMIATDFSDPAREQFAIAIREIQLGASIEEGMQHLEERMPNVDLRIIVNAIEILRQTGGNMVETFEKLTETLKDRKKVEGKIKTLTAQGNAQAVILCVMPFAMALLLYLINRDFMAPLFNTLLGWVILTLVVALVSVGWVIIQKIIAIEV